ncbi:hypothetical protein JZU46_03905 [bacterium]|jgi:hypothetical protein|nr:hypothetical protein [bacterium]
MQTMTTMPAMTQGERDFLDVLEGREPLLIGRKGCMSYVHPAQEARELARIAAEDAALNALIRELEDEVDSTTKETLAKDMPIESSIKILSSDPSIEAVPTESTPAPVVSEGRVLPVRGGSGYEFPITSGTHPSVLDLGIALQSLTDVFRATKDYSLVREQFCAISIALNTQGLWAPRFRPQPKVRPDAVKHSANDPLHLDHLVIDAHWLWANKLITAFSGKYGRLLDSTQPFDFALAAEYAREKWSSDFRASEFELAKQVQWQLCTTKSKWHADQHRMLFDGDRPGKTRAPARIKPIKTAISSWAFSNHRIRGEEPSYAALWAAREMLGSKETFREIGILAGRIVGVSPLDASTVSKKLQRLDLRLAAA